MSIFARIVVGVDGTDWGFEALRQALVLAPKENPVLHAVICLDTTPAARTGFPRSSPSCWRPSQTGSGRCGARALGSRGRVPAAGVHLFGARPGCLRSR